MGHCRLLQQKPQRVEGVELAHARQAAAVGGEGLARKGCLVKDQIIILQGDRALGGGELAQEVEGLHDGG